MTPMFDLTGVNLGGVLDGIKELLPTVIPVVISFIGFRKGYAFLKRSLRGA
jgi:hypothetical protein